jgi:hypothetical protein
LFYFTKAGFTVCSEREIREMLGICYEPFMEEKNESNSVPNPSWNASNSRDAGNILMQATAKTSTTAAGMPTRAGTPGTKEQQRGQDQ